MAAWQWVTLGVLVLIPMLLLVVFHGHRERLSGGGVPLERTWIGSGGPPPSEDDEHH